MSPSTSQPSKKPTLPNNMPPPPRPPQPPTKPRTPFPPAAPSAAPPLHQHPILKPETEQFDTSLLAAPPSKATALFCCGDLGFVTVETNTWHWTLNKFVTTVYDLKSFPSNPISPWLGVVRITLFHLPLSQTRSCSGKMSGLCCDILELAEVLVLMC